MSRLIIDITELANWQGKLTGVSRVMNELSLRFAGQENVVFVMWDGMSQSYRQIDFAPWANAQAVMEHTGPSQNAKFARSIAAAKKLKNSSRIASRALAVPERAARKLLRPAPFAKPKAVLNPQKDDTLLILADWHASDVNFVNYLVAAHKNGVHLVSMVYDLLPIVTPQYSGHATEYLTRYSKAVYPLCDLIITISKHTKKDTIKWLEANNLRVPPIEVVRLGDDFRIAAPSKPTSQDFVKTKLKGGDYLLCVGTVEARKNHMLLYYVYKLAKQRNVNLPKTVIVGRRGWKTDELFELVGNDPDTKDNLLFLQNTSDEELSWLYAHCLFTVYPSFYEGWGLPIAESLSRGIPPICSNTS
ncbi:MAG: glycosyltransferase family 4 protein, partial [Candidatus Saccharimonadales bacterium]